MSPIRSVVAALLIVTGCARPSPPSATDAVPEAAPADVYTDLRNLALSARVPGASPASALMELSIVGETATLVAVADGSTCVYLSNGDGIIGAGEHAPVRRASAEFLRTAGGLAERMAPTTDRPVPSAGRVRFYVVADDGLRTAEVEESALVAGSDPLSALYTAGQDVLTAIRLAESRR